VQYSFPLDRRRPRTVVQRSSQKAHAVFLRPLPYPDPGQLVFGSRRWREGTGGFVSAQDYFDIRRDRDAFQSLATVRASELSATITGDGTAERVSERMVSTELFATLGVTPVAGRAFVRADEAAGVDQVAILS